MFRVGPVCESISYVVLYLLVIFVVSMLTVVLFVCEIVHDTLYLCLYLCLQVTNKGEYPFAKIFVLVKGMKECSIFFF